jgi:hypothetical protein
MKRSTLSLRALWLAVIIAAIAAVAPSSFAQSACSFPACNLPGERYDAATGNCESGPDPITRALSHRIPSCKSDERFDRATGQCVLNACGGGGCEARELCPGKLRYSRSGRDSRGVYGVCESGPDWLGHRSHELRRCPAGFTLNEARGVCVGNCTPAPKPARLPDLVIRRVFLRAASGGSVVTRIRVGQRYYACFEVANVGAAASGPFHVGGGGLGVPIAPSQLHASLLPGGARVGCLLYPTTPAIGSYRLGIEADSRHVVGEIHEDNNSGTLAVNVVP